MIASIALRRIWLYAVAITVALFLVLPILIIIPMSFSDSEFLTFPPPGWSLRWYQQYFSSAEWHRATAISLQVAVATTVLSVSCGTIAAYGLHLGRSRFAARLVGIILLPAVIPAVLIAVGVFVFYSRIGLNNTLAGLVLAHTALALPFVILLIGAGMRQFDWNLDLAARNLGANRMQAFDDVIFPQVKFSIIAAALIAFLTSFDEVVVSIFISSGERATLTKKMFSSLRDETDPVIAAIASLLILLSIVVMAAAQLAPRAAGRSRRDVSSPIDRGASAG
ncbi:ABC transporter permease [Microvirga tunisiensis]|uniref:ABC transporter permease n=1 Tax=Microvirga tunisiensis TaxID=2108360 RepID=A0A5N7MM60_9HYPH|nr:ABC transporter permease [Microvirga tunisiensis]MPR09567.1 ABC transporter permease [Microvirga tunisiensis]MPR27224.1 ABC transporter permease [Microvirga tunisiensis]